VAEVASQCHRHDLPLVLEPIVYPIKPGQKKSDPEFAGSLLNLHTETARRLIPLGVDLLKTEFVIDVGREKDEQRIRDAYSEFSDAVRVPWVLLSGGVPFSVFERQLEYACEAGASGFLAGRAIWQDVMQLTEELEREQVLNRVAVARLKIL